jgi:hypothetical protein
VVVFRHLFAYPDGVDKQRESAVLAIAASIIAAIRLRGEPIRPSPKLNAVVYDSVLLAKLVMTEVLKR